MGLATFIGGIHPFEGKELSEDKPIKYLEPLQGEVMVYPLSQHIGAPAKPLVAKGDHVLKGQIIAEAGGFISANVLSSVSGTVKGIESKLVANGAMVQSILVKKRRLKDLVQTEMHRSCPKKRFARSLRMPVSSAWAALVSRHM